MRRQIGFEIRDMWYNLGELPFIIILDKNRWYVYLQVLIYFV